MQDAGIIKIEGYPPSSPDLNPIEYLWAELKKLVRNRNPTNFE